MLTYIDLDLELNYDVILLIKKILPLLDFGIEKAETIRIKLI